MKNTAFENVMDQELFDRVGGVICSVMAGDYVLNGEGYGDFYDISATQAVLDNIAENLPGIFKNKDFLIGLLHNIVRFDKSVCFQDYLMSRLFLEYVDESLKKDKEVVMYFIMSLFPLPDTSADGTAGGFMDDMLEFCRDIPHELLMDPEVLSAVLEKVNPVCFYSEFLTDEEKVDDHVLFKVLWAFMRYCKYLEKDGEVSDAGSFKEDGLFKLQEVWVQAAERIEDTISFEYKFHDIEESDFIRGNNSDIYGFFETFFDFLMSDGFLQYYNGVEPATIREKNDLYLQYLRETKECDIYYERYDEPGAYYSECPFACDDLMDIIKKYWYQICLFAAVGTEYHNMLVELCGGNVHNTSDAVRRSDSEMCGVGSADGEGYLCAPCDEFEEELPFT